MNSFLYRLERFCQGDPNPELADEIYSMPLQQAIEILEEELAEEGGDPESYQKMIDMFREELFDREK